MQLFLGGGAAAEVDQGIGLERCDKDIAANALLQCLKVVHHLGPLCCRHTLSQPVDDEAVAGQRLCFGQVVGQFGSELVGDTIHAAWQLIALDPLLRLSVGDLFQDQGDTTDGDDHQYGDTGEDPGSDPES